MGEPSPPPELEAWTANWDCSEDQLSTPIVHQSWLPHPSSTSLDRKAEESRSVQGAGSSQDGTASSQLPVFLNIYDVSKQESVKVLNTVLANYLAPVKFGGAFHTGIEVGGIEWSYGRTFRDTRPGLIGVPPRSDPHHSFRQTVNMGVTQLSLESINSIISEMIEDYPGQAYDVLRHNCCHFADDFCQRLGVSATPDWVHRLARFGAGADELMQFFFGSSGSLSTGAIPISLASVSSGSGCINDESELMTAATAWPPGAHALPSEISSAASVKDLAHRHAPL
eukprot:CAMPEP_0197664688 /NCGR_PEP_ID=MMETSP1338-20131121/58791_1 /TAXON_ID=43686 ORGANISM="Pelagodinium beii, Strain RCC1491" /NCGR_SAMPLE_ID=MMETSP1338 /ASSEMBLY_ACC=CAM_ASM_000754 /LENGTH=281 /DNA_ID=CAMNT_0043243383 /DNA_START=28 /DNA_END=873 /DNA_ORIENTATION=+